MISRLRKTITFALALVTIATLVVAVAAKPAMMGRLKTRDNKPVTVNGNKANSGTTLLSGSEIQCPDKVGATLDLGTLGRIDIAPKSDLKVSFTNTTVSVELRSGYVVLTTNKGVSGTVNTNDGEAFHTNSSMNSSVIAKTKGVNGPETAASVGASHGGISTGAAVGIAGGGAALVGGAAATKTGGRGSEMSTDKP
jgi:hypothetical protein